MALHRAGQALGECAHRIVQWHFSVRVPASALVHQPGRSVHQRRVPATGYNHARPHRSPLWRRISAQLIQLYGARYCLTPIGSERARFRECVVIPIPPPWCAPPLLLVTLDSARNGPIREVRAAPPRLLCDRSPASAAGRSTRFVDQPRSASRSADRSPGLSGGPCPPVGECGRESALPNGRNHVLVRPAIRACLRG